MAKRGRPPKTPEPGGRKVSLGLKVTPGIKARIDSAAKLSGRTQSQEAEVRLERSFERQDLQMDVLRTAYGPEIAGLLTLIGDTLNEVLIECVLSQKAARRPSQLPPISDPAVLQKAIGAIHWLLGKLREKLPPVDPNATIGESRPGERAAQLVWEALARPPRRLRGEEKVFEQVERHLSEQRAALGSLAPKVDVASDPWTLRKKDWR